MRTSPTAICTLCTNHVSCSWPHLFCLSPCLPPHNGRLDRFKVRNFLDPVHAWDPTLAFVMGGAVVFNLISFPRILAQPRPVCSPSFLVPTSKEVTRELVVGAAIFGAGEACQQCFMRNCALLFEQSRNQQPRTSLHSLGSIQASSSIRVCVLSVP